MLSIPLTDMGNSCGGWWGRVRKSVVWRRWMKWISVLFSQHCWLSALVFPVLSATNVHMCLFHWLCWLVIWHVASQVKSARGLLRKKWCMLECTWMDPRQCLCFTVHFLWYHDFNVVYTMAMGESAIKPCVQTKCSHCYILFPCCVLKITMGTAQNRSEGDLLWQIRGWVDVRASGMTHQRTDEIENPETMHLCCGNILMWIMNHFTFSKEENRSF